MCSSLTLDFIERSNQSFLEVSILGFSSDSTFEPDSQFDWEEYEDGGWKLTFEEHARGCGNL